MARGKGKRGGGRGSGRRFAAQSAEEIEQRNARLAEFDAARARRRADADDEKNGKDGGNDDDSVDSATLAAEREAMEVGRRLAGASIDGPPGGGGDGEWVEKEYKARSAVEGLIEVENFNRAPVRGTKLKDMDGVAAPMTRREREEKEKEAKAAAYRKRHELGLTEEYKHDMAKLNEVKARREKAAAKKREEDEAAGKVEQERREETMKLVDEESDSDDDDKKKKKKKKEKSVPKLDKITIKKMKPAQLKDALKVRNLDIQGNAKALQKRLLDYEQSR